MLSLLSSKKRTSSFGDIQFLDRLSFLGGATSLDSFLKAYKISDTKSLSATNGFTTFTKCRTQVFPRMTLFTVKLAVLTFLKPTTCNILTFWKVEWRHNKPLWKFKLTKPPPTWIENYHNVEKIWKQKTNKWAPSETLRRYNNKDVAPALEAMQKQITFTTRKFRYVEAGFYIIKPLGNICQHKFIDRNFYHFTEARKNCLRIFDKMLLVVH